MADTPNSEALAKSDLILGKIEPGQSEGSPAANASSRDAFLAWADEQGWTDDGWMVALMFLDRHFRPFLSRNGSSQ